MITRNTTIEDLVEDYPKSVKYLADKGIRCIKCGEPIWGTLEEACLEKNFTQEQIDKAVQELNDIHNGTSTDEPSDNAKKITIKKIK
jgi:methionine synthase II (cobalamin-independent)